MPLNISNLFISVCEVNKCNTRFSSVSNFYVKKSCLDKLHRSFSKTGVRIWNSISDDLCNSSKNKFKRKLHEILFSILIEEDDYVDLATIMKNFKHKLNFKHKINEAWIALSNR
jgi:hypothetical protein